MASKPKPQPAAAPPTGSAAIAEMIASGDYSSLVSAGVVKTLGPTNNAISMAKQAGQIDPSFQPFMEEDEWSPLSMSPDQQARIKVFLKEAGLYSGGVVGRGWTSDDAAAMKTVLGYANSLGIGDPLEAAKAYARESRTTGLAAKAPTSALVSRFANPEAVRQVVRKSSMDLLGQRLSDEEERRLVGGFQAQYQEAQRAQHAAQQAATGTAEADGTASGFTEALSVEEYAEKQLQGTPQAGAQRYLDAFDQIVQSLGPTVAGPRLTGRGGVA